MKTHSEQAWDNPRAWMRGAFEKNRDFLAKERSAPLPDWSRRSLLIGRLALGPIRDAVVCFAAGEEVLATKLLERGAQLIATGMAHFGSDIERDAIKRDRVELVLAANLGRTLCPEFYSSPPPVPFDAFPRYLDGDGAEPEEKSASRFFWGLLAVLERNDAEYEKARDLKVRTHPDLRAEAALISHLSELSANADHAVWRDYETVLARWLNPKLSTASDAYLFREDLAGALSLLWCRDRLRRLDRETLLCTYYGETLSIPVRVG